MRIIKILPAIFIIILFASCQKEKSNDPNDSPLVKLKTYTEDYYDGSTHNIITFNVSYDNSNRIISLISASSPGDKFVFQYSGNNYTMDLYNSGTLSIHEVFFLNSNSLVDSSFQYNDTSDSSTEKYIYNSSKQLITLKEYDYSKQYGSDLWNATNYTYDNNGNVITETDDFSTTTYEYYPSLLNNLPPLVPYYQASKNLVKTATVNNGGDISTLNHTYTFDASNRLSSETIIADTGESVVKTYTYY